ncbi:hypothetical protein LX15_002253 [Streptoalloteichus tenebrarius]|uniref:Uncharacterized protein n=1 Tax=Streptoalloteichus tenebrarius (strain ATCC 17920 / DSM 40477 / JCM 4838 / CBS 697.72 / NBRC 16177 / NCIMB 11028 / NRRL B-12390 / A12253. 1 / ISP 5477) TaxID=1933 RepID=A0ABT1HSQ5_STRSD|nr:hypothetical protein [Streptoalloteichus tenebrarius]
MLGNLVANQADECTKNRKDAQAVAECISQIPKTFDEQSRRAFDNADRCFLNHKETQEFIPGCVSSSFSMNFEHTNTLTIIAPFVQMMEAAAYFMLAAEVTLLATVYFPVAAEMLFFATPESAGLIPVAMRVIPVATGTAAKVLPKAAEALQAQLEVTRVETEYTRVVDALVEEARPAKMTAPRIEELPAETRNLIGENFKEYYGNGKDLECQFLREFTARGPNGELWWKYPAFPGVKRVLSRRSTSLRRVRFGIGLEGLREPFFLTLEPLLRSAHFRLEVSICRTMFIDGSRSGMDLWA